VGKVYRKEERTVEKNEERDKNNNGKVVDKREEEYVEKFDKKEESVSKGVDKKEKGPDKMKRKYIEEKSYDLNESERFDERDYSEKI